MQETLELSLVDILLATSLVAVAGGVSLLLQLHLERRLALAALRTVLQLFMIGYLLRFVFAWESPWILLPMIAVMLFTASRAAVHRADRRYPGDTFDTFLMLTLSGGITTIIVTQAIIGVQPWHKAQYIIPLLGMILGNGLTGISLCLENVLRQFQDDKDLIEMELAHGASRWEAARGVIRDSVRRGMIPIINSMSVVGLVSLPGMMTGQILAGNPPLRAVKYQIVVMFMIAAATSMGCIGAALLAYRRLFSEEHQLRIEQIRKL